MGSLFKSKPKPPPVPKPIVLPPPVPIPAPKPPPPIPVVDDAAIQDKKKRELAVQRSRSGRASTFLTDDDGALG